MGRYAVFDEIAAGGMATVHLGKLVGAGGFSRVVAIKRLHAQFAKDAEFSAMFMDEARLAARIHHPNVVQTLDVVTVGSELLLVMEYVHGVSFASLLHGSRKAGQRVDPRIAAAVVVGALEGLHAAHEAKSEVGVPLGVVHRDVSPQNVLVGIEGVARILDFGVAKAAGKMHATREGQLKGKLAYMSPEQVRSQDVTRQSDVFSTAIVLWEALMGERLFDGNNPAELIMQVIAGPITAPRTRFPDLSPELEAVVMKGLARDTSVRYATARDMVVDLESAVGLAPSREIARWVEGMAGATLNARTQLLERIERAAAGLALPAAVEDVRTSAVHPLAATYDLGERGLAAQSGTRSRPPPVPGLSSEPPRARTPVASSYPPVPGAPSDPPRVRTPVSSPYPLLDELREPARTVLDPTPPAPPRTSTPAPQPYFNPEPRPISDPQGPARPSSNPLEAAPSPPRARRIPIPVQTEEDHHVSLRERLEAPLKVVAVGVVLSVVDAALRPYLDSLPLRPLWLAEILVVAGVLWALARMVLPSGTRI